MKKSFLQAEPQRGYFINAPKGRNLLVLGIAVLVVGIFTASAQNFTPSSGPPGWDPSSSAPRLSRSTPKSPPSSSDLTWPARPNGKQFRIWVRPVTATWESGMDKGKTVDQASIIWQTGKNLPHCYDGGFATIYPYEPYQSHMFDKVSYSKRSEEFRGDTPCFMEEKYNPSFGADDKFILQVVQPIISYPVQNSRASIKWAKSKILNIQAVNFGDEAICFGPAPCPTDIPTVESGRTDF